MWILQSGNRNSFLNINSLLKQNSEVILYPSTTRYWWKKKTSMPNTDQKQPPQIKTISQWNVQIETSKIEVKVVPMTQKMITLSVTVLLQAATTREHHQLPDHTAIHLLLMASFGQVVDMILIHVAIFYLSLFLIVNARLNFKFHIQFHFPSS